MKINTKVLTAKNQGLSGEKAANARDNINAQAKLTTGTNVKLTNKVDADGNVVGQTVSVPGFYKGTESVTVDNTAQTISVSDEVLDTISKKVDKVAGERLMKNTEGTKLASLKNYGAGDGIVMDVASATMMTVSVDSTVARKDDIGAGKLTINYMDSEGVQKQEVFGANQDADAEISIVGRLYEGKDGIKVNGSDITIDPSVVATVTELGKKVDKVEGKGLSTNDYTTAEKTKLEGIEDGAQVNVTPDWTAAEGEPGYIANKPGETVIEQSDWSETDTAKQSYIKNKPTEFKPEAHTHAIADVTGLDTALDGKVDKVDGKGLSTNDYTTEEKTKLEGIEAGAQVNVTPDWTAAEGDAGYIENKPTEFKPEAHTHAMADVNGLDTALEGKVDKVDGKGLSTNDYTTEEKTKLEGIEAGAQVNVPSNWTAAEGEAGHIENMPESMVTPTEIKFNQNQFDIVEGSGEVTVSVKGSAASAGKFLKGDGTWDKPTDTTYTNGSGLTLTGTTFAVDSDKYYDKTEIDSKMNARAVFCTELPETGDPSKVYYKVHSGATPDEYDVYVWDTATSTFKMVDEASISLEGYWHGDITDPSDKDFITGITVSEAGTVSVTRGDAPQSDWTEEDTAKSSYIQNVPDSMKNPVNVVFDVTQFKTVETDDTVTVKASAVTPEGKFLKDDGTWDTPVDSDDSSWKYWSEAHGSTGLSTGATNDVYIGESNTYVDNKIRIVTNPSEYTSGAITTFNSNADGYWDTLRYNAAGSGPETAIDVGISSAPWTNWIGAMEDGNVLLCAYDDIYNGYVFQVFSDEPSATRSYLYKGSVKTDDDGTKYIEGYYYPSNSSAGTGDTRPYYKARVYDTKIEYWVDNGESSGYVKQSEVNYSKASATVVTSTQISRAPAYHLGKYNSVKPGKYDTRYTTSPELAMNLGTANKVYGEGVNIGKQNVSFDFGTAIGTGNKSSRDSIAIGHNTNAQDASVAIGHASVAARDGSIAFGTSGFIDADGNSVAIGASYVLASGDSVALGKSNVTAKKNAMAVGFAGCNAEENAIAVGKSDVTAKKNAMAVGFASCNADGESFAAGCHGVSASGYSIVLGNGGAQATGRSVAIGSSITASGASIGIGVNNYGTGTASDYSILIGNGGNSNSNSINIGYSNNAFKTAIAVGVSNTAYGYSAVIGWNNSAGYSGSDSTNGGHAFIFGANNYSYTHVPRFKYVGISSSSTVETFSTMLGANNTSYGRFNFVFGFFNTVGVGGYSPTTSSWGTTPSVCLQDQPDNDGFAIAIGRNCHSYRNYDMAIGYSATANGDVDFMIGNPITVEKPDGTTVSAYYPRGGQNFAMHSSHAYGSCNMAMYGTTIYGINNIGLTFSYTSQHSSYNFNGWSNIIRNILFDQSRIFAPFRSFNENILMINSCVDSYNKNTGVDRNILLNSGNIRFYMPSKQYGDTPYKDITHGKVSTTDNILTRYSSIIYTGIDEFTGDRNILLESSMVIGYSVDLLGTHLDDTEPVHAPSIYIPDNFLWKDSRIEGISKFDGYSVSITKNIVMGESTAYIMAVNSCEYNTVLHKSKIRASNAYYVSRNILSDYSSIYFNNDSPSFQSEVSDNILLQFSAIQANNGGGVAESVLLVRSSIYLDDYQSKSYVGYPQAARNFLVQSSVTNCMETAAFYGSGIVNTFRCFSFGGENYLDTVAHSSIMGNGNEVNNAEQVFIAGTCNSIKNESTCMTYNIQGTGNSIYSLTYCAFNRAFVIGNNNSLCAKKSVNDVHVFGSSNSFIGEDVTVVDITNSDDLTKLLDSGYYYIKYSTSNMSLATDTNVSMTFNKGWSYKFVGGVLVKYGSSSMTTYTITVDNLATYLANNTTYTNTVKLLDSGTLTVNLGIKIESYRYYQGPVTRSSHALQHDPRYAASNLSRIFMQGFNNKVSSGICESFLFGINNTLSLFAEGETVTDASGRDFISNDYMFGNMNVARSGSAMFIAGSGNYGYGHHAVTIGLQNKVNHFQTVIGKYNAPLDGTNRYNTNEKIDSTRAPVDTTTGALFIVGNGYAEYDHLNTSTGKYEANNWQDETYIHRSNAMVVWANGKVTASDFAITNTDGTEMSLKGAVKHCASRHVSSVVVDTTGDFAFRGYTSEGDSTVSDSLITPKYTDVPVTVNVNVDIAFPNYLTDTRILNAVVCLRSSANSGAIIDVLGTFDIDTSRPRTTLSVSDVLVSGAPNGIIASVMFVEPSLSLDEAPSTPVTGLTVNAKATVSIKS